MAGTALYFAQGGADPDTGARLWRLANGSDDDGTSFDVYALSAWIRPFPSSESVYYDAYVTITWSMNVTVRFKPVIDETADVTEFGAGAPLTGSLEVFEPEVQLEAPTTGRLTRTFRIPLMRTLFDASGNAIGRNYLVGRRIRFEVSTVGGLGAGDLILDGCELECEEQQDNAQQQGA